MKLDRMLAQIHAQMFGYFWLPCPICGECFSGAEWEGGAAIPKDDRVSTGVCPKSSCMQEAKRRVLRYRALRMMGHSINWSRAMSAESDETMVVNVELAETGWYGWLFKQDLPEMGTEA